MTLEKYITEAISSGKSSKYLRMEITIGKTTIPDIKNYLEYNGYVESKEERRDVKSYTVFRFRDTYMTIVNPENTSANHFSVYFGNPKISGKLTINEIFRFKKGFGVESTVDEFLEYINS